MKLRPLQRNEQILLALILVVCAFLGERTVVDSLHARSAALDLQITELERKTAAARAEKEKFGQRDLASLVSFPPTAELDLVGSSSEKLSRFLTELAEQESDERFRIVKLATEAGASTEEYVRTPVTLTVEASFPAIGHFLERLEDAPFLAEVDSLEVYRMENDLRLCAAKIRLLSYAVKEKR